MHTNNSKGWLKHGDFILIYLLCMQLCYVLGYWITQGMGNPYASDRFQYQAIILLVCQLLVIIFSNSYTGIVRRGPFAEFIASLKYMLIILIMVLLYLFALHQSSIPSRLHLAVTSGLFVLVDTVLRELNKKRIIHFAKNAKKRSIVLITSEKLVPEIIKGLGCDQNTTDFFISKILLMGIEDVKNKDYEGIEVLPLNDDSIAQISHEWVDEVFILQPEDQAYPVELTEALIAMGITVHYTMSALLDDRWSFTEINKLGSFRVLTGSIKIATPGQAFIKRLMDILGGFVGCIFTILLTLIIGPAIYIKSPGPIFFAQKRIGKNGKVFKIAEIN